MKYTVQGWGKHYNKQRTKLKRQKVLFDPVFVEIISLTRIGVLGGVFLANHLASTDM